MPKLRFSEPQRRILESDWLSTWRKSVCYSAQVWAAYKKYLHVHGAELSIKAFVKLYGFRHTDPRVIIPKAMDAAFASPTNDDERAKKPRLGPCG